MNGEENQNYFYSVKDIRKLLKCTFYHIRQKTVN